MTKRKKARRLASARFRQALLDARQACKMTQVEAAAGAGILQSQWSDYERGRKAPGLDIAERMAAVVGRDLADLLEKNIVKK